MFIRPTVFYDYILSLVIAEIAKAGAKGHETFGHTVCGGRADETDSRDFPSRLLAICRKRPSGRGANNDLYKISPAHAATSWAHGEPELAQSIADWDAAVRTVGIGSCSLWVVSANDRSAKGRNSTAKQDPSAPRRS